MLIPGSEVSIPGTLLRVKGDRAHVQLSTGELLVTAVSALRSAAEVEAPALPGRVRATALKDRQR